MTRFFFRICLLALFLNLFSLSNHINATESGFSSSLNTQIRFDDRSGRDPRWQYRLRWYPNYAFSDSQWSLHSFVSTGDDFSGSHNTINASNTDYLYVRRMFARYQSDQIRTEIGVIPTYKGRVSSSGLSKNGFIKGIRSVFQPAQNAELEFVIGSLNDTRASHALGLPDKADYIELELSVQQSKTSSYEFSLERMTDANYFRTEYRMAPWSDTEFYFEWIKRLDNAKDKAVIGFDSQFSLAGLPIDAQGYYTYVSAGIGERAEFTEDFISTGHGVSLELKAPLSKQHNTKMFFRFDGYKRNTRFILGVELKI